jgi:hypothetical protein
MRENNNVLCCTRGLLAAIGRNRVMLNCNQKNQENMYRATSIFFSRCAEVATWSKNTHSSWCFSSTNNYFQYKNVRVLQHILADVRLAFQNIRTNHVEINYFEASHAKNDLCSFPSPLYLVATGLRTIQFLFVCLHPFTQSARGAKKVYNFGKMVDFARHPSVAVPKGGVLITLHGRETHIA